MVPSIALLLAARLGGADSGAVCYALRLAPWSLPGYASLLVPDTVRLSRGTTADGGAVRPDLERGVVFGEHRRPPGTPNWRRVGADSLALRWSDGFTGVVLRARVQGDSLRGRAETFTDVGGSRQASAVVAGVRTACSGARRAHEPGAAPLIGRAGALVDGARARGGRQPRAARVPARALPGRVGGTGSPWRRLPGATTPGWSARYVRRRRSTRR